MKKMLVVTSFPPNQSTAGQNYTRLLLNEISGEISIDLIYFSYQGHDLQVNEKIHVIKRNKNNIVYKLVSVLLFPFFFPFFSVRLRFSLLFYLCKVKKRYDILYFDFSQVFLYSLFIRHPRKVLMVHDVIFQKYKRKGGLSNIILFFLKDTERRIFKRNKEIYCLSKKDVEILQTQYEVIAKRVDILIDEKIKKLDYRYLKISNRFCFYAAWNRAVNYDGLLWFIERVYPELSRDSCFDIIGGGMNTKMIKLIYNLPNINYCGFLENPYQTIAQSRALIAPIFQGAGVKVKVLEALAVGTNVIGTTTAFEGIEIEGIAHSLTFCKNEEDFIKVINSYPKISPDEKKKLRNKFNENYPKCTFKQYL